MPKYFKHKRLAFDIVYERLCYSYCELKIQTDFVIVTVN